MLLWIDVPIDDVSARDQRRSLMLPSPFLPAIQLHHPLATNIPGGEFLEALLMVSLRPTYGCAKAAGRSGGRDQGRYGVNWAGATSLEAAEAIGAEEAGGLRARRNAQ